MKNMPEYLTLEEVDGLLFQEPNFYHDLMGLGESITKLARVPFSEALLIINEFIKRFNISVWVLKQNMEVSAYFAGDWFTGKDGIARQMIMERNIEDKLFPERRIAIQAPQHGMLTGSPVSYGIHA